MSTEALITERHRAVHDDTRGVPAATASSRRSGGETAASIFAGGRVPSLDGLRALSILAVLLGHLAGTSGAPSLSPAALLFGDYANLGVRIFFVISGFLITSLLLREQEKTGAISIRQFFIRRVFRIFPAAYFYLLAMAVMGIVFKVVRVVPGELPFAATYTINFVVEESWVLGHLWSLAVEEQFYVLWPAAMALLSRRNAQRLCLAVLGLAPLARLAWLYWLPNPDSLAGKAFPTIADALAVGCLLALARRSLDAKAWYLRFLTSKAFLLVPLAIWITNRLASHTRPDMLLGQTIRNVAIAVLIDRCVRFPNRGLAPLLNTTVLITIGQLSYSLYLWQQPFLDRNAVSTMTTFPLNLLLAAAAGVLSYSLVEKPFLRLRERLYP